MAKEKNKELLKRVRQRYQLMVEADEENRRQAMEDMKFVNVPGAQWEENMKKERGDRPCYEFNKLRITAKRIINDMRLSRPAGKVRGVEGGDKETADIYEGLIRNIWNISDGDTVIDYAAEYQVSSGIGAWRIVTEYADDTAFEQDIKVEAIHNPFCLYHGPEAKDLLKRDAPDWIVTEKISKESYEARYPKAEIVDFESTEFDDEIDWRDEDQVRIAEYWYKEPYDKEIWQLQDGKVIEAESDEAANMPQEFIKNKRIVKCDRIMMVIVSGEAILEGPTEWAGSKFPFVMVHGEYMVIDGKRYWWGLPRFAKDAQRSYNVSRTAITETIAQAPQAKWWATAEQAKGHTEKWAEAHQKNFPFLLFNPDPKSPGPPIRMGGAEVPVALIQETQIASEELKSVTGIFSPDIGAGDAAKSGVQERERRAQGQVATFNYKDNMDKGLKLTWEILIDLIPKIYDTERELRIIGTDGAEDYKRINTFVVDQVTGQPIKVNDLSVGRYDVVITTGPSFSTQRQEAAEIYMSMAQTNPNIMGVAGDLIFKSLDLPYSEDIAERLQALLPPEIQQQLADNSQGMSSEVQAAMNQANQAMQLVQQQMAEVQQAAQQIEVDKAEVDKGKANVEKLIADLQAEEAKFEAEIAQQVAKLTQKDANLQIQEAQFNVSQKMDQLNEEKQALSRQFNDVTAIISQVLNDFMGHSVNVMSEIQQRKAEKPPRVIRVESKRENGKLVAIPIFEDLTGQEDQAESTEEVLS